MMDIDIKNKKVDVMNLADQLNEQFQKRGFPFSATQNPECAIVSLPNGNSVDILIDNMQELDPIFGVMSIINEHDPQLLNQCNYFDDETFKIETTPKYDSDMNYTIGCGLDFRVRLKDYPSIYSSIQHETRTTFIQNGVLNHVDILFDNETDLREFDHVDTIFDNKNELNTSYDYFKSKLISMLDNMEYTSDKQKIELQYIDKKINPVPSDISFTHKHDNYEISNTQYTGSIRIDEIYKQLDENQIPLHYRIEQSDKPKFVLYNKFDQLLAEYEIVDGYISNQLVRDLNFIDHLYTTNPDLATDIYSINENGSISIGYNNTYINIHPNANNTITLTTTKYNPLSEVTTETYGYDWLRSTVNITSSVNTNMNHLLKDMDNLISTNTEVSDKSVDLTKYSISRLFLKQPVMTQLLSEDLTELSLTKEDLQVLSEENLLSEEDLRTLRIDPTYAIHTSF